MFVIELLSSAFTDISKVGVSPKRRKFDLVGRRLASFEIFQDNFFRQTNKAADYTCDNIDSQYILEARRPCRINMSFLHLN